MIRLRRHGFVFNDRRGGQSVIYTLSIQKNSNPQLQIQTYRTQYGNRTVHTQQESNYQQIIAKASAHCNTFRGCRPRYLSRRIRRKTQRPNRDCGSVAAPAPRQNPGRPPERGFGTPALPASKRFPLIAARRQLRTESGADCPKPGIPDRKALFPTAGAKSRPTCSDRTPFHTRKASGKPAPPTTPRNVFRASPSPLSPL